MLFMRHLIIKFDYNDKKIKAFNELNENEKTELISEINKLTEKASVQHYIANRAIFV